LAFRARTREWEGIAQRARRSQRENCEWWIKELG
jgi:hypothetical protein